MTGYYTPKKYNYIIPPKYLTEIIQENKLLKEIKYLKELYNSSIIDKEVYLFLSEKAINNYIGDILKEVGQDFLNNIQNTLLECSGEIIYE